MRRERRVFVTPRSMPSVWRRSRSPMRRTSRISRRRAWSAARPGGEGSCFGCPPTPRPTEAWQSVDRHLHACDALDPQAELTRARRERHRPGKERRPRNAVSRSLGCYRVDGRSGGLFKRPCDIRQSLGLSAIGDALGRSVHSDRPGRRSGRFPGPDPLFRTRLGHPRLRGQGAVAAGARPARARRPLFGAAAIAARPVGAPHMMTSVMNGQNLMSCQGWTVGPTPTRTAP